MPKVQEKLGALEGVRGVAAFMVVLHHLQATFVVGLDYKVREYFDTIFPEYVSPVITYLVVSLHDGNFAIWVFWVMSGFVLSIKYFKMSDDYQGKGNYILGSIIKRYFRLLVPVLFSVIFAYILLASGFMTNRILFEQLGGNNRWLASFYNFEPSLYKAIVSAIWDTFFHYDRGGTYNAVLWTMQAEYFGSLFLFAFLSIFGNRKMRYYIYPVVLLYCYAKGSYWLGAFVLGILLCDLYVNTALNSTVMNKFGGRLNSLLFVILILILIGMPNYGGIFHLILATVLVFFTLSSNILSSFFSSSGLVYLGKISLSLYLVHLPIICSVTGYMYFSIRSVLPHAIAAIVSAFLTIVLSLAASTILYKYGDEKGILLGRKFASFVMGKK